MGFEPAPKGEDPVFSSARANMEQRGRGRSEASRLSAVKHLSGSLALRKGPINVSQWAVLAQKLSSCPSPRRAISPGSAPTCTPPAGHPVFRAQARLAFSMLYAHPGGCMGPPFPNAPRSTFHAYCSGALRVIQREGRFIS